MDPTRFDALTRFLATRPSRRAVLRGLTGGLTAGLLGRQAVADDCKAAGKACSKASQCCSGLCAPPPSGHTSVAHSGSACCATGQVIDPGGACCTPDPKATTCAGTCGTVTNNCGQSVDCDGCDTSQCLICQGHTCVSTCGTCQACSGGSCQPTSTGTCQTAGGSAGSCCAGECCPSSCRCLSSGNGIFCYSGRIGGDVCSSDADCTVAGTSCQQHTNVMQCLQINCTGNADVCPAGSQCTGGAICEELCTAS